ncbi:hypothetical protein ASG49_14095 [Marmoricola sp. Leaf446]|uniref:DNA glycosylase AlkZ-like family protein n=1 Tax=Marmoricola sp. Leaf446 TaxID=1736379 RepID=UPI0006FF64EF|nr:crosslink repair DNA glycosylase YcaQ family protein [Marmoricola sp. Leaf446]KQT90856.1 hypothetical protein ASG49_14095 [Marmoricola sp. Leaf446]
MDDPPQLTREQARRIAVRAQLLDLPRPTDLLAVVRRLTVLQHDQTAAVAPHADLVLWSRLGAAYSHDDLEHALARQDLLELDGMLRPAEDLALFRADMSAWPGTGEVPDWRRATADWVEANTACRLDLLERLRGDGPLTSRQLPDSCVVPWRSSGWNDDRNVVRLLDLMEVRGEVAVVGREGRDRLWDLAERVHPDDAVVPADEADRTRRERRLAALGLARERAAQTPGEPDDVGPTGVEVRVEGVRGRWRADADLLAAVDRPFEGRTALLSPLDRLVMDRKRMRELFEFDYQLEMYKPAAQRRWGYFALPVLHGDRLVGKVDATSDHTAGVLHVDAVHEDEPFDEATAQGVREELASLARFLRLQLPDPA